MTNQRMCPDCVRGRGPRSVDRLTDKPCERCKGMMVIDDLGPCTAEVFDVEGKREHHTIGGLKVHTFEERDGEAQKDCPGCKPLPCPFPADLLINQVPLCDGHALTKAIELKGPCPHCGGDPTKGMHRGEVIGLGKVMACGSSQAERHLQDITDELTRAAIARIDHLEAEEAEGEEDPGASCLTDGERNPSMGGVRDPRDYD